MLYGVAVCDGKVLLNPGVEFGHVADLGIIVEDDVGLLLRQKRIVLFKTRVAVGARDDGRLRDGQRAVCHQKAEAVLLADGLEHALARIGGEGFIQAFLHVGGLGVGPGPGGGAAGDPFGLDGRDRLTVPAGLQHKAELRHGTGQQKPGCQQCRRGAVPPGRTGLEQQRCRSADRGPEQVHKGRWQRDQRGAQDKQVRRYAGQPAQPEQQAAQGAVVGLAPVTPERPAAGQRERRAHVAEIQLLRTQAVGRAPEREEERCVPKRLFKAAGKAAALAKEHPGGGQRHTGQGRQPAVADDGGKLGAEHGKTVRCGKIILWVV